MDDQATVQEGPGGAAAGTESLADGGLHTADTVAPRSQGSTAASTTISTPRQALEIDELRRTQMFTIFVMTLALLVSIGALIMGGDETATAFLLCGTTVAFVGSGWVRWRLRHLSSHRPIYSLVFGYSCVTAVTAAFYYFGPASAVVLVVPIGAYFFALGSSRRVAIAIVFGISATHLMLTAAMAAGLIEDRGMITFRDASPLLWSITEILIQFIFVAAYVMARTMRRSTLDAIEQLDGAVRGIVQREALFQEAKQDLERALRVGGPGRYTDQVVGSYRLGNLLGRGAIGEVYDAVHADTGELAAVKLLSAAHVGSAHHVHRFLREIRIAESLRSENVVSVREVADDEAPLPYLAMERLRGSTLSDVLRQRRRLRIAETAELIEALCDGVAAAHGAGIVHRDLKPQNVFLHTTGDGREVWKILDFGASKLLDNSGTLTQGGIIGTPAYMAPEQARGDAVDHRADLYALGAIAYRALTGRPAFSGGDTASVIYRVIHTMPPRPSVHEGVDPVFDALLAVAMAKRPDDRFGEAGEVAAAFDAAARGELPADLEARARRAMDAHPWQAAAE